MFRVPPLFLLAYWFYFHLQVPVIFSVLGFAPFRIRVHAFWGDGHGLFVKYDVGPLFVVPPCFQLKGG